MIEYFKLEARFPRIAKGLAYRQKFQTYYLSLYITSTLLLITYGVYVDILAYLYR